MEGIMTEQDASGCSHSAALLSAEDIKSALVDLPGWEYDAQQKVLTKRFDFKGFYKTMAFVNAVAWVANKQQHHPDMQIGYNYALINWQTHAAGGVTKADIICASESESLYA